MKPISPLLTREAKRRLAAIVCVLWPVLVWQAQGQVITLSHNNALVQIDVTLGRQLGMFNWSVDGTNQLNQQWFWYRVGNTSSERSVDSLGALSLEQPDLRSAHVHYDSGTYAVEIDYLLTGGSSGSRSSAMQETITISNRTASDLDFHFFEYQDVDLGGAAEGDVSSLGVNLGGQFNETCQAKASLGLMAESVATPGANHGEAAFYNTTLVKLDDSSPTTLNDNSGPTGPGDATSAMQWDLTLAAGSSVLISKDVYFHARPTTWVVSNTNDNGLGSLRRAILDASPGDTITFGPNVTGSIVLTSGELPIGTNLTVNGPGAKVLTISGNNASRVFHITGGSSVISGLRIANGNTSGAGGGILVDAGTLNLTGCTVAACYAGYAVGGGGIFLGSAASLSLVGSTVSGNSTPDYGGGLYLFNGAQAFVLNSTISGNSTLDGTDAGWGGGIFVQSSGSTLQMFSSTVANNSSVNAGGGIYRYQGTVTLANTLVAGNSAPSGPDCKGTFVSGGYNLIGNSSGSTGFGSTGDQLNVNPMIGPLADNGGPTFTHALLTGSPAIDKGKSFGVTTDQRGLPRPFDFANIANASGGDGSDIGASEVQPPLLTIKRSGGGVVISWPSPSTGFVLQQTSTLTPPNWVSVSQTPADNGITRSVLLPASSASLFFRLKK
jgi:hypothetical protein